MFPLVALGALAGGIIAAAETFGSSDSGRASSASSQPSAAATRNAVSPQSYIVTPISTGAAAQASSASMIDAVRNFTV